MSEPETAGQQWHQQPAIWIVLGVLAFTVVSSFILLVLALQNPPQMVVEDYTTIAETSARELQRDKRAQQLGLQAAVEFVANPGGGYQASARLDSAGLLPAPQRLRLRVKHSTLTALDSDILLERTTGAYAGTVNLPDSPFDLFIEDEAGTWRLSGRLPGPVSRVEMEALGPAAP
ncbi:MAG: FixH family protein [Gammaproteobacteria bacterium]|jgi:hypothetical protein|nr:FixH family protein [Gammaproteobacteria bacterium]